MHLHKVKIADRDEEIDRLCWFDNCPQHKATSEEIGWFYDPSNRDQNIDHFDQWLEEYRARVERGRILAEATMTGPVRITPFSSAEQAALVEAVKKATDEDRKIPFVKHNADGTYTPLGEAKLVVQDGVVTAAIQIDPDSLVGKKLLVSLIQDSISIQASMDKPQFPTTDAVYRSIADSKEREELQEMGNAVVADLVERQRRQTRRIGGS